jgi:hypothetical protein
MPPKCELINTDRFKLNHKYYISFLPPLRTKELSLRMKVHELTPKSGTCIVDYITFSTLSSSKDMIEECGLNSVAVPLPCIKKVETLHDILDKLFIDDIIYLINEYI